MMWRAARLAAHRGSCARFRAHQSRHVTVLEAASRERSIVDPYHYGTLKREYASAIKIIMPALSPTMTEGVISKWIVKEGDEVSSGDVIFEMETDKATMEVESPDDGVVAKILVPASSNKTPVNSLVALMVEPGENPAEIEIPTDSSPAPALAEAASSEPSAPQQAATVTTSPAQEFGAHAPVSGTSTLQPLLPSVKILVEHHNLNPGIIPATGPKGHLLKGDVLRFLEAGATVAAPTPAHTGDKWATDVPALAADFVDLEISNMRKIIAARLSESKQTIPHTYATVEVQLDRVNAMRKQLQSNGHKVSVNDFIIRAAGRALREVPGVNAQLAADGSIKPLDTVDISVAVATPTGLITPIITNADARGVVSISGAIKDLAGRARDGKLKPHEFQGGSFSISNLGMFGISEFSAVINPPQAAIMAVGAGRDVAVPVGTSDPFARNYTIATFMTAKVSYDERVIDSETMAHWLTKFKTYMDDPSLMV